MHKKSIHPRCGSQLFKNTDQQDLEQHAQSGGIAGFTKALGREWPSCKMSILILQDMSIDKKVESVCFELQQNESLWEIFRTDSKRYSVVYEEIPSPQRGQFKGPKTPTILLTGGPRGVPQKSPNHLLEEADAISSFFQEHNPTIIH